MIKVEKIKQLADAWDSKRILVVGDLMLDRFIYGDVTRISPEAPVPVVCVRSEQDMPGGACNVAGNVRTLGGGAAVAGFIGGDAYGGLLRSLLNAEQVDHAPCLGGESFNTIVKTRVIAEHQQVCRVDRDEGPQLNACEQAAFLKQLEAEVARADGVVIEDYGKGVVTQECVDVVLRVAQEQGIPVGYDPKDNHALNVSGISIASPNRREAFLAVGETEGLAGEDPLKDEALLRVASQLQELWGVAMLLVTLGPQGMLLVEAERAPRHIPTRAKEVYDVSGAGDTVIASCVLALSAGAEFEEVAELANLAAGVVVGKLGTAPCTFAELLDAAGERKQD